MPLEALTSPAHRADSVDNLCSDSLCKGAWHLPRSDRPGDMTKGGSGLRLPSRSAATESARQVEDRRPRPWTRHGAQVLARKFRQRLRSTLPLANTREV